MVKFSFLILIKISKNIPLRLFTEQRSLNPVDVQQRNIYVVMYEKSHACCERSIPITDSNRLGRNNQQEVEGGVDE